MLIKTTDNRVIINDSTRDAIYFNIPISIIDQTIEEDISKWVINVAKQPWSNRNMLFDLSKIICEKCPGNSIDWEATFFWIEKKKAIFNKVDKNDSKSSLFDQTINMIKFGQQSAINGIDDKLRKTISLELEVNGILDRK